MPQISQDFELQERIFNQMVDCISELHRVSTYHRDIKPHNFLIDGDSIVVSDLGLSMELDSRTAFTRPSQYWGTQGYIPPEFFEPGGFKNATPASDIYMLGKSFYHLLTGKEPQFISDTSIPKPLFYLIEKCCNQKKELRYQSAADLKQGLKTVYDVLFDRTDLWGLTTQKLSEVIGLLERRNQYNHDDVADLMHKINNLDKAAGWEILSEFPQNLFIVLANHEFEDILVKFLPIYEEIILTFPGDFSYAETVASNMKMIFVNSKDNKIKSESLKIAIKMAAKMNRFAAMNTCIEMICSINDNDLALLVHQVLIEFPEEFIKRIEITNCKNAIIRNTIKSLTTSA